MKRKINAKVVMLEHSKAKVELYSNYLATYLNILSRTPYVDIIHIYDLMCGEGVYADGSKGSPVVTIEKIKEHYFSNNKSCPNINVWFNDKGRSEIEEGRYKIERVEEICSKIFKPNNVNIKYTKRDYIEIYHEVVEEVSAFSRIERALIFLDPYGYKEIKPEHLKEFLDNGKTELILFLPISHMYRFAKISLSENTFVGGASLRDFLTALIPYNNLLNNVNSPTNFIYYLKDAFKNYLKEYSIFVDKFTIQRDSQNVYCLFFFTPNALGFEKMLEAKWKLDEARGKGFRLNSGQEPLFSELEISNYPEKLKKFIKSGITKTNPDLYIFGLNEGFLPKHTTEILRKWQRNNPKFKVYLENGNEARRNAFYLSYKPKKIVKFLFE